MQEYESLRDLREACGEDAAVEVLLEREWWVLRATPKGMLWVSRPGRNAIHAVPSGRGERFRVREGVRPAERGEEPPAVIALGPEEEQGIVSVDEGESATSEAPRPRRRSPRKDESEQLDLFG